MAITLDDSELMQSPVSDVCWRCKHLRDDAVRACAAFPDRIPDQIWNGWNRHTSPYPGDNGIQFEPVEVPK